MIETIILLLLIIIVLLYKTYTYTKKLETIEEKTKQIYSKELDHYKQKAEILEQNKIDATTIVSKEFFEQTLKEKENTIALLQDYYEELKEKYAKLMKQKKSSEVKTGLIGENLMPFLDDFPFDAKKCRAMFNPIDLIHFGEDSIDFIELKTGASKLSQKQKKIEKQIKGGQVTFNVVRLDEEGLKGE